MTSIERNFSLAKLMHSVLVNRSKSPSDAITKKSSVSLFIAVILISGSLSTKFFISFSCVYSFRIEIFLHSKSPNALVTANLPRTLPKTMKPPWLFILSCSSFREAL